MWAATLLDHSTLQILTLEGMYSLSNHLINKLIMIKKVAPRDEYHKGMQRRQPPSHQGMITPTRAPFKEKALTMTPRWRHPQGSEFCPCKPGACVCAVGRVFQRRQVHALLKSQPSQGIFAV